MEGWRKKIENKNKAELKSIIKSNEILIENIKTLEDIEEILSSYWQIRKNYEQINHLYYSLSKFVSDTYYNDYIEACFREIYYYEKLLQMWRYYFPENNIQYNYYIELAKLQYDFFIKNNLKMPKELREEIFHYKYREDEEDKQNIFIILNNLKIAQKRLEMMALINQIKNDYDELFIIYDILGNLFINMYMLLNLYEDNITAQLDNLILQSYNCFTISYENKLINEDPTLYREGIVNIPYIDLFYRFFDEKGFVNYYSIESKIKFLRENYSDLLEDTFITKKLEEMEDKGKLLLEQKKEIELNLKSVRELQYEKIKSYNNLRKRQLKKDIIERCEAISKKFPLYQNNTISPTDVELYINQFEDEEIGINILNLLKDRAVYINKEQMQHYLLKLLGQVAPKSTENVKLVVFKSGFQESTNVWTYFINFYSDQKYDVLNVGKLNRDIQNLNIDDERYYVFMDDVVGTGNQFISNFTKELGINLDEFTRLRKKFQKIHFKLIAVVGSWESKINISETLKFLSISDILFEETIHLKDKAFYKEYWKPKVLKKTISFLKERDNQFWQGYGQSEYLVILEWNVPNNTIGCLWNNPNGWKPLFPRR